MRLLIFLFICSMVTPAFANAAENAQPVPEVKENQLQEVAPGAAAKEESLQESNLPVPKGVTPELKAETSSPPSSFAGDGFVYDPTGKRDPFQPDLPREKMVEENKTTILPPTEAPSRPTEPLEAYELSQLKVAAIIWETRKPRAMVIDPTGSTHYIRVKTRIGKKNGYVAAIREGEIVVVEYSQENGQYTKSFKVLELR